MVPNRPSHTECSLSSSAVKTGCWKMLTAILTASERFLDLKIISQQQPPQGVTRVFKVKGPRPLRNISFKSHSNGDHIVSICRVWIWHHSHLKINIHLPHYDFDSS
ncbi:uncharacterized protein LOC127854929 [Dreissena polymorpha]|uniref:uncharacterized protein LOC127854929 n=1 Tax=Dreissena polymorpha TaxID=45954 RepID=UPI002264B4B0|nr:uncharacterized protein LOC127854929 [Dreissena polymorpha]